MAMSKRKFYKTVIRVEVLSEWRYNPGSLEQIARDIYDGDCSGRWDVLTSEEVDAKEMAQLLMQQGSDPEFFRLSEKGEDIESNYSEDSYIQFEYDLTFYGGDYSDVGKFAYVPAKLCDDLGFERAFQKHTGYDPCHIIHYSPDELYTAEGDLIED